MKNLVPWLRRSSAVLRPKATRFYSTSSSILSTPQLEDVHRKFWLHKVDPNQMFYSTRLSFAMMNICPLCPGHILCQACIGCITFLFGLPSTSYIIVVPVNKRTIVPLLSNVDDVLVCPRREVMLFSDLTSQEVSDLWISAQKIGVQVKNYHGASSTTYLMQDGRLAGQTIPHVHIHIIPRVAGDWKDTERIYDDIYENEKELRKIIDYDVQLAERAAAYRRLLSLT